MRTLQCSKCGRTQAVGKFCLDCGGNIIEKVTIGVEFQPIKKCARSAEGLKSDMRKWLARIGVENKDIQIINDRDAAEVNYTLLGQQYTLKSHRQKNFQFNLAAVEQLLHFRVLGIERGIETREQAFAAYVALPGPEDIDPKDRGYAGLSKEELKNLLFLYHPDTGKYPSSEKFNKVKTALDSLGES